MKTYLFTILIYIHKSVIQNHQVEMTQVIIKLQFTCHIAICSTKRIDFYYNVSLENILTSKSAQIHKTTLYIDMEYPKQIKYSEKHKN